MLDGPLEQLLVDLLASNSAQWDAEDRSRDESSDAAVAAAKRDIDRLNAQRVALIERISDFFTKLVPNRPGATPLTETPGAVCDRLSILAVRIEHAATSEGDLGMSEKASLELEAKDLCAALDAAIADVSEGRRRFMSFPMRKSYGKRARMDGESTGSFGALR